MKRSSIEQRQHIKKHCNVQDTITTSYTHQKPLKGAEIGVEMLYGSVQPTTTMFLQTWENSF